MADVFLSYSRQDRGTALEISRYIEQSGLTVWWDSALSAGASFQDQIQRELDAAKAVIVIWSPASVRSEWVVAEASAALSRRKLISVKTGDLGFDQIPPPFNTVHILDIEQTDQRGVVLEAVRRLKGQAETPLAGHSRATPSEPTATAQATDSIDVAEMDADYDVFVAYSRKDSAICEELVLALRSQELIVFYDQSLKSGERWRTVIANNIERTPAFVALISKDSMASTEVQDEINLAKGTTASILPVKIDSSDLTGTFKLMLGNINIVDASSVRESVFRQLALQIKTTVALRAFAARRTVQGKIPSQQTPPILALSQAVEKTRSFWLPLAGAFVVLISSTAACALATQEISAVAHFDLADRLLLSFVAFGIPYTLICMAAVNSILK